MRNIGTLPNELQARLFGDYLFSKHIRNQVERDSDNSWCIWVEEDDQLDVAGELLKQFRQSPDAKEFKRAAGTAEKVLTEEEKDNERFRRRVRTGQQLFPGFRRYGVGVLTYALIIASVYLAVHSRLGADRSVVEPLFISATTDPQAGFLPEVRAGEVWRLVTPMLVHFSATHILFNMMWLFTLGSMIEGLQGRGRLLALVVLGQIVSGLAQYYMKGPFFGGMSGVNYALFGYVWLRGKTDPGSGLAIDRNNTIIMLVWLVVYMTGTVGPVANWAHGGGFAFGCAWGWISGKLAARNPR